MTNNIRTADEIEREIEEDRARLTDNITSFQESFSVDNLMRQVSAQFRAPNLDALNSVGAAARRNPVATALVGAGIAWMFLGGRQNDDDSNSHRRASVRTPTGPADPRYPDWVADTYASDFDEETGNAGQGLKERAANLGGKLSDTASDAVAKAGSIAESAKETSAALRDRLARGTEDLSEAARERVIAARFRAVHAQRAVKTTVRKQADTARDFHDQQPLVFGAIAMAVGAAIGGVLPRTDVEDKTVGAKSDELMAEAERIFAEERSKLRRVAASAADEAKAVIRETKADLDGGAPEGKTAAKAVAEQAKSAAGRVVGAAKDAASDEKLGKPRA